MEEKKNKTGILILIIVILIIVGMTMFLFIKKINSKEFKNNEVSKLLEDYLELKANLECNTLLEKLNEKGKIKYNSSKDVISDDGTITTTVKFSDYKKAMLKYVSEYEFEERWIETDDNFSTCGIRKNSNNYLTKDQGDGDLVVYTVKNISLDSKLKNGYAVYKANVSYIIKGDEKSKPEEESFLFQVKHQNGKYVINNGHLFVDYVE